MGGKNGLGLNYENMKDMLPEAKITDYAAKNKELLSKLDPKTRLKLEVQTAQFDSKLDAEKQEEQNKEMSNLHNEAEKLRSDILADLNNDGKIGGLKNETGYNRIRGKQEDIDQYQKDIKHAILSANVLDRRDGNLVGGYIDKGVLVGVNFRKGLMEMYRAEKFPDHKTASKEDQKYQNKTAREWANSVADRLKDAGLWDDVKAVNRKEKREDRMEKRAQRKTEYNEAEIIFSEGQLQNMFDTTVKAMGKDAFAQALYAKISAIRPNALRVKWDNMKGLNQTLSSPGYADQKEIIKNTIKDNLQYMQLSSMQEWLVPNSGEKNLDYQAQVEASFGTAIDMKIKNAFTNLPSELTLDPAATQEAQRILRSDITAMIAAGYADINDAANNNRMQQAGMGAGVNFDLKRATALIDNMTIAVGANQKGEIGVAVKFDKNIDWNTGSVKGTVGSINFIPFARIGLTQTINEGALKKNIKEKRIVQLGAYAQAAPGYMSTGVTFGNNLEKGIDRQADYVQAGILEALNTISASMNVDAAVQILKNTFTKAKAESLKPVATYILDGLRQGYAPDDIASALAAMWKNESTKNTKGKVDASAQVGVGILGVIPVVEAFVGLKIYGRTTMLEDKFDRDGKERKLSTFRGFAKFDNADVKNMSIAEKLQYWFSDKLNVTETDNTITLSVKENGVGIYDQFDVFIKDKANVKVTDTTITFSKGDNVLLGKLIGAYKEKQKIYIGYDKQKDIDMVKFPINGKINGKPENIPYMKERTMNIEKKEQTSMIVDLKLDAADIKAIDTIIRGNKEKFIKMTNLKYTTQKTKEAYNGTFGEFVRTTEGTDMKKTKAAIDKLNGYVKIFDKNFDALWAKEENKRYIINAILETASHSAKIDALRQGKGIEGMTSVGKLLEKRRGHIKAFENSGIKLTEKSFAGLYEKAKNIDGKKEKYTTERIPQAIALVGYYRSGLKETTGFMSGDLDVVKGYTEPATETAALTKLQETFGTTREFTLLLGKVNAFVKESKADAPSLTPNQLKELIKNGTLTTVDGVKLTLPSNFVKMLFGPCANEGFMLTFGQLKLEYKTTTVKKEKAPGDLYIGMENTENYQKANSINIGLGAMAGQTKKEETPPEWEDGTPVSNPGDDTTPTVFDGDSATNVGGDTIGTDTGDGSPNGE